MLNKRNQETNECCVSQIELAEYTGLNIKSIKRLLKALYEHKYLIIDSGYLNKKSSYFFPKESFFEDFKEDKNQINAKKRNNIKSKNSKECVAGIYLITNTITGAKYVGQATNIRQRWIEHIRDLRNHVHCNKNLQKDFDEYGEDSFNFEVLEIVKDSPVLDIELDRKENKWGKKYEVLENGYNIANFIDPFKS